MSEVRIHHGIETPHPVPPAPGFLRLEGWAFIAGGEDRTRVRLRVGAETYEPDQLIERVDVAAAFPQESHAAHTGFRFLCYPPFGVHLAVLEASTDGREWHPVCTLATPVASPPVLGAFEKPPPGSTINDPARVEGWCFHPSFHVERVVLTMGRLEIPCEYGLPRPDVARLFPQHPEAALSGFITTEDLPRGSGRLRLRADTTCGRSYFLDSTLEVDIRRGKYPIGSRLEDVATPLAVAPEPEPGAPMVRPAGDRPPPGARNILFVLYGDFTCNSALHVSAIANELIELGYDCVVAGPAHKETIRSLSRPRFLALEFAEWESLPAYFRDGCGPTLIHAWTPRENVRQFTERVSAAYGIPYLVHLEDHEDTLLATHLERSLAELERLSPSELDALVPSHLTHPRRGREFLRGAAGVTVIVAKLEELVPKGVPVLTIWPAANREIYFPREPDPAAREALGIRRSDTVLFYHGNVHAANAAEVASLYEAVTRLNERGERTFLLRTGRDDPGLLEPEKVRIQDSLLSLGHLLRPRYLPQLMRLADYFVQPGVPGAFNDHRFPSKLPEFFALGRPVILPRTNLGCCVRQGEDAFVLDRADGASIADAVSTLRKDPELTQRLARGAVAYAQRWFSWQRTAANVAGFYTRTAGLPATGQE